MSSQTIGDYVSGFAAISFGAGIAAICCCELFVASVYFAAAATAALIGLWLITIKEEGSE